VWLAVKKAAAANCIINRLNIFKPLSLLQLKNILYWEQERGKE